MSNSKIYSLIYPMIYDIMVFTGRRLDIINELLKIPDFIPVRDLCKCLGIDQAASRIKDKHIEPLCEKEIVDFDPKHPPNYIQSVRIAHTTGALQQLLNEYPDLVKFHRSVNCQNMINVDFVKYIKTKWNYPDDESVRQSYREVLDDHQQKGECLEITQDKCLEMANKHIRGLERHLFGDNTPFPYLSDDELLFILKSSHSVFKFAMTDVISHATDDELLRMKEDILLFSWHPFCWEDVPGKDSIWLINFLESVGMDWAKTAKIKKSSDNKEITISNEEKSFTLKLKDGKNIVKINEKSYVFYSKEVKKGCTMASFLHTDPDALDNNSLKEKFSQLPDMWKKRYLSPIKQLIPNQLFLEQILLNFISDVRFGCFIAQPLYFTELKVELKVQMNLNGQEMITKDISYKASNSY